MVKVPSRQKRRRSVFLGGSSALTGLLAATVLVTTPTGAQAAPSAAGSTGPASFAANCGTAPVTMQGYFETGFPDIVDLTQLFTKQYPNVTWKIREDAFAVINPGRPVGPVRSQPS